MKKWKKPMVVVGDFISSESVSVCWGIKCERAYGPDHKENDITWHRQQFCGDITHQYIIEKDNNGKKTYYMTEVMTDDLGDLPCTVTNGAFDDGITDGEYVEWETSSSKAKTTWHHYGHVDLTDKSRPNHS